LTGERGALDRVLSALGHPVRRRILGELADGPGSASSLARKFEVDLGVVSYHLNKVLAGQCKVVELIDTVPRRGSVEKIYRLRVASPLELPMPEEAGSAEEMAWAMSLGESLLEAIEASEGKT
jgi:DNA-binding transcriptional ArsR family regulator